MLSSSVKLRWSVAPGKLATLTVLAGLLLGDPAIAAHKAASRAARKTPAPVRNPIFLFPVDLSAYKSLTSSFGARRLFRRSENHFGVDFAAPEGSWAVAAAGGTVVGTGQSPRSGWWVRVAHAGGWATVYCHMRDDPALLGVTPGLVVKAQTVLGHIGHTGRATGAHLHFAVRDPHDQFVDPLLCLFTPLETLHRLRPETP